MGIFWLALTSRAEPPLTPGTVVRDAYNVLLPAGADPWVVRHDGQFLLCGSNGAIFLKRSPDLTTLGAGETRVIHRAPESGPLSRELWAPELHRLRGRWYVYYAADDGDNATTAPPCWSAQTPTPSTAAGKIADACATRSTTTGQST